MGGSRAWSIAVLAAAAMLAGGVHAEELKLGHFMSPRHVMHTDMMAPWAEAVAKESGGRLTVKIFPANQLGGKPPTQFKLAADGIADIAFGLQGYTSSAFPRTTLTELPDFGETSGAATERIWALYPKYIGDEYKDVKVLALWANDAPVLISKSKPIRTLEDLRSLKVRTPSAMQSKLVRALGGVPVDMPVTEMYNALDRGVVDALWVPPSVILDFKLMEVGKFYTRGIPPARSPFFLVMNKRRYDALPADQRAVLDRTSGVDLSLRAANAYERRGAAGLAAARGAPGVQIIDLPPAEAERWRKAMAPAVAEAMADAQKGGVDARAVLKAAGYVK